jgi:hypothetical protein
MFLAVVKLTIEEQLAGARGDDCEWMEDDK